MVLIKSVLMSLPVYYLSTECVPKDMLKRMNSLMARFFWGKMDDKRYLTPVAWKTICRPCEEGGLGVRDIDMFGEALFMKLVWAMMEEENKLWVQVCKAKYCPKIGFWDAKPDSRSSGMWRNIMRMKENFKGNIRWQIGDGRNIKAIAQPWFTGWEESVGGVRSNRKKVVADLFYFSTGNWKEDVLNQMFTQPQVEAIKRLQTKPTRNDGKVDKLIWEVSKTGRYSVKEGYQWLWRQRRVQFTSPVAQLWQRVQKWKGIAPKVKIFLWRLISGALMIANNLHRRINRISPMCQRCRNENEFEMHCFFFCQGSRAIWFGRRLGLRTQDLPLNVLTAFEQCTANLKDEELREFSYTLWKIWKARNEEVIQNKKFDVYQIQMRINAWLSGQQTDVDGVSTAVGTGRYKGVSGTDKYQFQEGDQQFIVDGSWDSHCNAGAAYIWYQDGKLSQIRYSYFIVTDPFHAEVVAVKNALYKICSMSNIGGTVHIFCDSKILVDILLQEEYDSLPNWKAVDDVIEIGHMLKGRGNSILVRHVSRDAVAQAHVLANLARRGKRNYEGTPRMWIEEEGRLQDSIQNSFFQRVQDAPP
ncbi:hypothetical protein LUZ63_000697 [Rhynchospora breviuscula]|uniref:Reverse transcriptase zinc-binding domain-containing protein n=1 Tax=Rhynchospora breviuscula TaxID=2022672 RepID=A0A9Q0HX63_9POAL|nr:hypothetical protein LUZ63_000697 [Rhynchospora breviuscula]